MFKLRETMLTLKTEEKYIGMSFIYLTSSKPRIIGECLHGGLERVGSALFFVLLIVSSQNFHLFFGASDSTPR
jgi:hypothetical protein